MTKKHFIALARSLAYHRTQYPLALKCIDSLVEDVSVVCRQANPNFDQERFLAACDYHKDREVGVRQVIQA